MARLFYSPRRERARVVAVTGSVGIGWGTIHAYSLTPQWDPRGVAVYLAGRRRRPCTRRTSSHSRTVAKTVDKFRQQLRPRVFPGPWCTRNLYE